MFLDVWSVWKIYIIYVIYIIFNIYQIFIKYIIYFVMFPDVLECMETFFFEGGAKPPWEAEGHHKNKRPEGPRCSCIYIYIYI